MIIRLTKANFSSNNIGQYTTEPGTLTFNVSPSNATATLTCAAMSPSTKTGTGTITWANIPAGSTVSYEVSLSGYNTQKGSISIYGNTTKTITLSEVGSTTPPVTPDPEEPGTGGSTPSVPAGAINLYNANDPDLIWGQTTQSASTDGSFVTGNNQGVSGYINCAAGDVIRGGTYRTTTNTDGTNYYPYKSSPVYWYDSNKNFIGATPSNPCFKEETSGSNDFKLTVPSSPSGIAYFRVMISKQYPAQIITVNNVIDKNNYVAYPNPTTLEGIISEVSTTVNMFNPADSIINKTVSTIKDGPEEWTTQSERGVSGFIQVKGGDIIRGGTYRETTNTDGTNYYPFKSSPIYLYDSQLNFMGRINGFTETSSDGDFKATIPMGVKYFRTMINTKYNDSQIITINNSIDKSNFISYSKS